MRFLFSATIFVNRGWVPKSAEAWSRPEGLLSLSTIVAVEEKMNTFSPVNAPGSKRLLWLEGKALLNATHLSVQADPVIIVEVVSKYDSGASLT